MNKSNNFKDLTTFFMSTTIGSLEQNYHKCNHILSEILDGENENKEDNSITL